MKTKYSKENLEQLINKSKNLTDVLRDLKMSLQGNSRITLMKYINLHSIDISHFETTKDRYKRVNDAIGKLKAIPLNKILVSGSTFTNTGSLKNKLYDEGLKKPICEKCGQDEIWRGEHISMILDHINGIHNDNRLENLRIVCPNCNAALPTHCRGANKIRIKPNKRNSIKNSMSKRKIVRPEYSQLKEDVNNLGYSGTGRKYGVSDNAIRKWIKFYEKCLLSNQDSNLNYNSQSVVW